MLEEENGDDVQYSRWVKQTFDKVTSHVGRVFLCDATKPEELDAPTDLARSVGTVGLMDEHGESICSLHTIYDAVEDPSRYKIHVVYPNYYQGRLGFEAKVKNMDEDVDICVLEPVKPLSKPWIPTSHLDLATDAREGDYVYCFFYPKDPNKHQTPKVFEKLLKPDKPARIWRAPASSSSTADHPTVISGNICFSEWMQGVATYERLPDPDGGLLVSRSGRIKGIHVKAFTCGELQDFVHSDNTDEMRVAKKLSKSMGKYAPSETIPVFVPPHGLVRILKLQGGSELLQAALLQNKEQVKVDRRQDQKCKVSKRKSGPSVNLKRGTVPKRLRRH